MKFSNFFSLLTLFGLVKKVVFAFVRINFLSYHSVCMWVKISSHEINLNPWLHIICIVTLWILASFFYIRWTLPSKVVCLHSLPRNQWTFETSINILNAASLFCQIKIDPDAKEFCNQFGIYQIIINKVSIVEWFSNLKTDAFLHPKNFRWNNLISEWDLKKF